MTIVAIIFIWLFVNMWTALIYAELKGTWFSGFDELAWLLLYSVISLPVSLLISVIVQLFQQLKGRK